MLRSFSPAPSSVQADGAVQARLWNAVEGGVKAHVAFDFLEHLVR